LSSSLQKVGYLHGVHRHELQEVQSQGRALMESSTVILPISFSLSALAGIITAGFVLLRMVVTSLSAKVVFL